MGNRKSFFAGMGTGALLAGLAFMAIRYIGQDALCEARCRGEGYEDDDEDYDFYEDDDLDAPYSPQDAPYSFHEGDIPVPAESMQCDDGDEEDGAEDEAEDHELAQVVAPVTAEPVNWDDVFAGAVEDDGFFS